MDNSKHYAMAITCGAKRGPKNDDLTFSPASLRDFLKAIAAPVQEPVGYADSRDLAKDGNWDTFIVKRKNEMREGLRFNVPLYCYPIKATQRQWVGLNAEDLSEIPPTAYEGAIWADAKLREKNT